MYLAKGWISADAEITARRDIIRREENRQLVGRRIAVSYAEGVLTYRRPQGRTSLPLLSVMRPKSPSA